MKLTPEELGQHLQQLIDRHREDLSILLEGYGIEDEPTPALLMACFDRYGEAFTDELASIGEEVTESLPLSHVEGESLADKIFGYLATGTEALKAVNAAGGKTASAETEAPPKAAEGPSTKNILIVSGVIIVALVTLLIIFRKRGN